MAQTLCPIGVLIPLKAGRFRNKRQCSWQGKPLRLNPLKSGEVPELEQKNYISNNMSLNPLKSGEVPEHGC